MMDLPKAYVTHAVPGRVRLKIPARRGKAEYFRALAAWLESRDGVDRADANPRTASVLIRLTEPFAGLAADAEDGGLFSVAAADELMPTAVARLRDDVAALNTGLARMSGGEVDLASATVAALLLMALGQALRGNIATPAISLLWFAVSVVMAPERVGGEGGD